MKKITVFSSISLMLLSIFCGFFPLIEAQDIPVSQFTYVIDDFNVTFDASSSYDSDGMIETYHWDFGDNTTGNGAFLIHQYQAEGIYNVALTVTDEDNNTNLSMQIIMIDMTSPSTTINLFPQQKNGKNDWYICPVVIDFFSYDNISGVKEIKYKLNGNSYSAFSRPVTLAENKRYTLDYYSIDNFLNIESTHSININIDTNPPFTQLYTSKGSNNGWYKNSVNIGLETHDNLSGVNELYYRVNGGEYTLYSEDLSFNQGLYILEYFSADNAGNAEQLNRFEIKVDSSNPSIELVQSNGVFLFERKILTLDSTVIIGGIQLEILSTDIQSGVQEIEFYIDNTFQESDTTSPYNWYWDDFSVGIHTVKIKSYDMAGNSAQISEEILFFNLKLD